MELLDDMCHMESHFGLFGDIVSFGARQVHGLHLMHQDKKLFWTHPMVLLGQGAQVKAPFRPFGDSANLDARQMHSLHGTYDMLRNQLGRTSYNSMMICVIWYLASFRLETVLVLVEDMCTVYA